LLSRNAAKPSLFRPSHRLNRKQKQTLRMFKTHMNQIDGNETWTAIAIQAAYANDGLKDEPKDIYKVLTLNEIRLLADALRGVGSTIERCPEYLDRLCADRCASIGDGYMEQTVDAAMTDDQLDAKWDIEGKDLLRKVRQLPCESRRTIVLGVVEFWDRSSDNTEDEGLHWVLDEVNTAIMTAKPVML
jgi:hypothetical protein